MDLLYGFAAFLCLYCAYRLGRYLEQQATWRRIAKIGCYPLGAPEESKPAGAR